MKLYWVPNTCSLSVMIALNELGISHALDRVDVKAGKKTDSGKNYLDINPKGYVPALEMDDGQILCEASVILQYLADLKPDALLIPKPGTLERIRMQEVLHFIASELHKGFSPLYHPKAPEEFKAVWKETKVFPRMDRFNADLEGRTFVFGNAFSVADAYAFYILNAWQKALRGNLDRWPNLRAHYERLLSRPSIQKALQQEASVG